MTITHPQQALSVSLCSDQLWVQVYSGEKLQRQGLAVEPMSCPPNAFNSGIDGNDSNLLIVFYVQIMPDDFVMQLHRF